MKRKYPYFLIPRLVGKNALSKIINADSEFYERRRKQLLYFITYLATHPEIKDTREFKKFIYDLDFDEQYFKSEDTEFDYPEASKFNGGVTNRIYGLFSSLLSKEEEVHLASEKHEKIQRIENNSTNFLEGLKKIKKHIVIFLRFFILGRFYQYIEKIRRQL